MGNKLDDGTDSISAFLEEVWSKKLWILTTMAFLFAAQFVIRTYFELPETFLKNIQRVEMLQRDMEEERFIGQSFDILKSFIPQTEGLFLFYEKHYAGKDLNHVPSEDIQKQGIAMCAFLRKDLAQHIGTLRGLRLHNPEFRQFTDNILQSMQEIDALIIQFHRFFESVDAGRIELRREAGQKLDRDFKSTFSRLIAALDSSSTIVTRDMASKTNEIASLHVELKSLQMKYYGIILAIIYILLYIVFAIRAYVSRQRARKCTGETIALQEVTQEKKDSQKDAPVAE